MSPSWQRVMVTAAAAALGFGCAVGIGALRRSPAPGRVAAIDSRATVAAAAAQPGFDEERMRDLIRSELAHNQAAVAAQQGAAAASAKTEEETTGDETEPAVRTPTHAATLSKASALVEQRLVQRTWSVEDERNWWSMAPALAHADMARLRLQVLGAINRDQLAVDDDVLRGRY